MPGLDDNLWSILTRKRRRRKRGKRRMLMMNNNIMAWHGMAIYPPQIEDTQELSTCS
jgi:hypothetical protein